MTNLSKEYYIILTSEETTRQSQYTGGKIHIQDYSNVLKNKHEIGKQKRTVMPAQSEQTMKKWSVSFMNTRTRKYITEELIIKAY